MIHPPLDELIKHTGNRYTLVTIAAKRARQIINAGPADDERPIKAVTIALGEIINDKIKFKRTKIGIK